MTLVEKAAAFAKQAHEGQTRKYTGEPYFVHCASVAKRVAELVDDDVMIAAAYLHDTVEDTYVTHDDILREFGKEVRDLVYELTDQYSSEEYPYANRFTRKNLEAERLGYVSKRAQTIKLCDLADNTKDIIGHDPGFAKVYMREKAYILECMGY